MLKRIRTYALIAIFVFGAGYVAAFAVNDFDTQIQRQQTTQP